MAQLYKKYSTINQIFKNEGRSPFVRFVASIRMLEYIAKTPAPYFKLEDVSTYTDANVPDVKTYRILDTVGGTPVGTIQLVSEIDNLDAQILSTDFEIPIQNGNVITLSVTLTNANSGSLELPFDEAGDTKPNRPIGESQNFQFVITTTDFAFNATDDVSQSFLSLVYKAAENLAPSLLSLLELSVEDFTISHIYLQDVGIDGNEESGAVLVYRAKDPLFLSIVNPDIAFDNVVVSTNGDTLTNPNDNHFVGEYGNRLIVDFDVINLFRSPLSQNIVQLQKHGSWITIDSENIQPTSDYWFGSVAINLQRLFEAGDFVYEDSNHFRLIAEDEQGNQAIYNFSLYLDYPLNVEIFTSVRSAGNTTILTADNVNPITISYDSVNVIVTPTSTDITIAGAEIANAINANATINITASFDGVSLIAFKEKRFNVTGNSVTIDVTGSTTTFSNHLPEIIGATPTLAGEPDTEVEPLTTVTDADGEVIEAMYDFKNFIYIKTDRQTLSNINVEYSLDNIAWSNAEFSIVTVGGWDYVKVLIQAYSVDVYYRIEDTSVSSLSRTLLVNSTLNNPTYEMIFTFDEDKFGIDFFDSEASETYDLKIMGIY